MKGDIGKCRADCQYYLSRTNKSAVEEADTMICKVLIILHLKTCRVLRQTAIEIIKIKENKRTRTTGNKHTENVLKILVKCGVIYTESSRYAMKTNSERKKARKKEKRVLPENLAYAENLFRELNFIEHHEFFEKMFV